MISSFWGEEKIWFVMAQKCTLLPDKMLKAWGLLLFQLAILKNTLLFKLLIVKNLNFNCPEKDRKMTNRYPWPHPICTKGTNTLKKGFPYERGMYGPSLSKRNSNIAVVISQSALHYCATPIVSVVINIGSEFGFAKAIFFSYSGIMHLTAKLF